MKALLLLVTCHLSLVTSVFSQGAPNVCAVALAWNWTYPSNIAGLQFWVKADALALNDGAAIATWPDSSGNARDATQGVGLSQPALRTGILNGKAVARFDQVADVMTTANFGLAQPCQVFIVTKFNQARLTNDTLFDGLTSANLMRAYRNTASNVLINAGANLGNVGGTPENFHIHSLTYNSTFSVNSWDGGFRFGAAEGNVGTANAGGITLNASGLGLTFAGQDMAEMIVYSPQLSSTDRNKIERYLSNKYQLQLQH